MFWFSGSSIGKQLENHYLKETFEMITVRWCPYMSMFVWLVADADLF
jgi:hypothetical protein